MEKIPLNTTARLLVVRLSAIGDVAITPPVVAQIRAAYPKLKIVVLTPTFMQPFFRGIDGVEFFSPDFAGRHHGIQGLLRLASEIGHFDYVADLHNVIRTKYLRKILLLRGAKVAHINKGRKEKRELTQLNNKLLHQIKHTVDRYAEVFEKLGFTLSKITPPLPIQYALSDALRPIIERATCSQGSIALVKPAEQKWVGIAPFAQHDGKMYPIDKTTELISHISKLPNIKIFIFGGGAIEKAYGDTMQASLDNVISVIGQVKLDKEMELISNLDLMMSMDSSAMHMASLVGLRTISIWGATHHYAGFYGIGQNPNDIVSIDRPCRPCSVYGNKPCIYKNYPCLNEIPTEAVIDKIINALDLK